jgi:hypothetical protein
MSKGEIKQCWIKSYLLSNILDSVYDPVVYGYFITSRSSERPTVVQFSGYLNHVGSGDLHWMK